MAPLGAPASFLPRLPLPLPFLPESVRTVRLHQAYDEMAKRTRLLITVLGGPGSHILLPLNLELRRLLLVALLLIGADGLPLVTEDLADLAEGDVAVLLLHGLTVVIRPEDERGGGAPASRQINVMYTERSQEYRSDKAVKKSTEEARETDKTATEREEGWQFHPVARSEAG